MAKSSTFALPEGVQLDVTGDQIDIRFDGNVEISTNLGRRFGSITAGGDLTIRLPGPITGNLRAGGVLTVSGDVDCGTIHAGEIVLGKQNVKCRALSADRKITVGPATVIADVVIAPEIVMDPKAQGRVTVIESANERGATKIKGGFGLSDYEDMFGNANEFLEQRGVKRLDPALPRTAGSGAPSSAPSTTRSTPQPPPTRGSPPASSTAGGRLQAGVNPAPPPAGDEVTMKMPLRTSGPPITGSSEIPPGQARPAKKPVASSAFQASHIGATPAPVHQRARPGGPPPPAAPEVEEEDTDDPLSLSLDDLEPLVEANSDLARKGADRGAASAAAGRKDDLHQRLTDALDRITSCYEGTDLPPAVEELKELVRSRDYDALRQNITEVWNGLLGFHQRRGIRPHHQVTHAFNVIHGLVQP